MKFVKQNDVLYKACCGNCKNYNEDSCHCMDKDRIDYYKKHKWKPKRFVRSDIACKKFIFIPKYVYIKRAGMKMPRIELLDEYGNYLINQEYNNYDINEFHSATDEELYYLAYHNDLTVKQILRTIYNRGVDDGYKMAKINN